MLQANSGSAAPRSGGGRGWLRVAGWLVVLSVGVFSACGDLVTEPRADGPGVVRLDEDPNDPLDTTQSTCGNGFAQWQCDAIEDALDFLRNHWNPGCQALGESATMRYEYGMMQYDGTTSDYGYMYTDQSNTYLGWSAFDPGELANTIAHEEAHHYGYEDLGDGSANDAYMAGDHCGSW